MANLNASVSMESLDELALEEDEIVGQRTIEASKEVVVGDETMHRPDSMQIDMPSETKAEAIEENGSSDEESRADVQDEGLVSEEEGQNSESQEITPEDKADQKNMQEMTDDDRVVPQIQDLTLSGVLSSAESLGDASDSSSPTTAVDKSEFEGAFLLSLAKGNKDGLFSRGEVEWIKNVISRVDRSV